MRHRVIHGEKPGKFKIRYLAVPLVVGIMVGVGTYKKENEVVAYQEQKALHITGEKAAEMMPKLSGSIRKRFNLPPKVLIEFNTPEKIFIHNKKTEKTSEVPLNLLTKNQRSYFDSMTDLLKKAQKIKEWAEKTRTKIKNRSLQVGAGWGVGTLIVGFVLGVITRLYKKYFKKPEEEKTEAPTKPKEITPHETEPMVKRERKPDKRILRRIARKLTRMARQIMHMEESVPEPPKVEEPKEEPKPVEPKVEEPRTEVETVAEPAITVEMPAPYVKPDKKKKRADEILDEIIAAYGKITTEQQRILDVVAESMVIFVAEFIRYMASPPGERGVFIANGALGGFRQKWKVNGTDGFGEWIAFSKTSGQARVVIAININQRKIGIYDIETNHEKYTSKLANFNPERVRAITIGKEQSNGKEI